jgi:cytochrome P450
MSADPYPIYHRLRRTHPVYRFAPMNLWIVTSYEAINGILRNPQFSSDRYPRMQQQLAKRGLEGLIQENVR